MQTKIEKILKDSRTSKAHIWMISSEFEILLSTFTIVCNEYETKERSTKKRQYWWRKSKLWNMTEKLFFILWYLKTNPKYDIAWVEWWVDKSVICDYIVKYIPILLESLTRLWCIPPQTIEESRSKYKWQEFKILRIDATERVVTRSTKKKIQEKYYSGKKNIIQ